MMSRQDRKKKKCFKCGELGHMQWRCLKKDDDVEEQKRYVNFATPATDEDDRPILLLASTARSLSGWFLDSGTIDSLSDVLAAIKTAPPVILPVFSSWLSQRNVKCCAGISSLSENQA